MDWHKCCCIDCPPGTQRCCVPDELQPTCAGTCLCDIPEETCTQDLDGIYYPPNHPSPCNESPCVPRRGCCYSDPDCPTQRLCENLTFSECQQKLNGVWEATCEHGCPNCNASENAFNYSLGPLKYFSEFIQRQYDNAEGCTCSGIKHKVTNSYATWESGTVDEKTVRPWGNEFSFASDLQKLRIAGLSTGAPRPTIQYTMFNGSVKTLGGSSSYNTVLHYRRDCSRLYCWLSASFALWPLKRNWQGTTPYVESGQSCKNCDNTNIVPCPPRRTWSRNYPYQNDFGLRSPWKYNNLTDDINLVIAKAIVNCGTINWYASVAATPTDAQMLNQATLRTIITTGSDFKGVVNISLPTFTYVLTNYGPSTHIISHTDKPLFLSGNLTSALTVTAPTREILSEYDPAPPGPSDNICMGVWPIGTGATIGTETYAL